MTTNPAITPGPAITLPPDTGRRFIVFGDAEEEFDWSAPFSRTATHTSAIAALPAATARFNNLGVIPTYLCDYPVVTNPASAEILQRLEREGRCTVGAQLHPWVTPPFKEDVSGFNSFASNLPPALERAKLEVLSQALTHLIGAPPRVYRAGRYGIRPSTFQILRELGYEMDVSIRSHFDYRNIGGPTFSGLPIRPWKDASGVMCLPLTSGFSGHLRSILALYRVEKLRGPLSRLGLISRNALTPEGTPLSDALNAIAVLDGEGLEIFSLSFHTPSFVPGHTPYVRTEADLTLFWKWWEAVLSDFDRRGIKAVDYGALSSALRRGSGCQSSRISGDNIGN